RAGLWSQPLVVSRRSGQSRTAPPGERNTSGCVRACTSVSLGRTDTCKHQRAWVALWCPLRGGIPRINEWVGGDRLWITAPGGADASTLGAAAGASSTAYRLREHAGLYA